MMLINFEVLFLHRLPHWKVLITVEVQVWLLGWRLSRRNWIYQYFQLLLLDLSLKPWSSGKLGVNTRRISKSRNHNFFLLASTTVFLCTKFLFRISEEAYVNTMTDEINKVVKLQEELDIDVLVHGEPEVRLLSTCCRQRFFFNNITLTSLLIMHREMTWSSTLGSSYLVLPSP